jgi:hypothetical protein
MLVYRSTMAYDLGPCNNSLPKVRKRLMYGFCRTKPYIASNVPKVIVIVGYPADAACPVGVFSRQAAVRIHATSAVHNASNYDIPSTCSPWSSEARLALDRQAQPFVP